MSYLVLILPLVVLGVILLIVMMTSRGKKSGAQSDETVCGECGYNVRGLSTFTCPECGSDLRDVGIITPTPQNAKPSNLWWQIPVFTVCCMLFGLLLSTVFQSPGSSGQNSIAISMPLMMLVWIGGLIFLVRWNLTKQSSSNAPRKSGSPESPEKRSPAKLPIDDNQRTTAVLTIMFIDMQDYSAQTASQSRIALAEMVQRLRDVVEPYARRRNGRIVKSLGDGLLLTFASPTEALLGGREIQQEAGTVDLPPLRIGVSTGEVSVFTDDVLGEPVNLASRIEKLAEPGHVFFSEATFHAMTRSEVKHALAGEFDIKGFDRPRPVYRVE